MIERIKSMLDELSVQLQQAKRERDEYKMSYQNVCAENDRLKQRIAELESA